MVLSDKERKYKLNAIDTTVHEVAIRFLNPSEYFSPIAQPVSNIPAIKRNNQAIFLLLICVKGILFFHKFTDYFKINFTTMLKIYHNPRCSKSRAGLQYLNDNKIDVEIVEYLKEPLTFEDLKKLLVKLHLKPHDLVRTHEEVYKKQFKEKNFNDDEWIKIMVEFPALIKRPIIEREHAAVWGETVENIEQFLSFKTK